MLSVMFAVSVVALAARADDDVPSESQCRPYIEKALKELESGDADPDSTEKNDSSEVSVDDDTKEANSAENDENTAEAEDSKEEDAPSVEVADEPYVSQASVQDVEGGDDDNDSKEDATIEATNGDSAEQQADDSNQKDDGDSKEEASADEKAAEEESNENKEESAEAKADESQDNDDDSKETDDSKEVEQQDDDASAEKETTADDDKSEEADGVSKEQADDTGDDNETKEDDDGSQEKAESEEDKKDDVNSQEKTDDDSQERNDVNSKDTEDDDSQEQKDNDSKEDQDNKTDDKSGEEEDDSEEKKVTSETRAKREIDDKSEGTTKKQDDDDSQEDDGDKSDGDDSEEGNVSEDDEGTPEEDLLKTGDIPENLRSRDHINQILRLDEEASEAEITIERAADIVLRDLKRLYENSIKPLEVLYKYRDLSNRHFGDPEIFSKPLVLFMGPWSGGKSSILNYLTGLEFTEWSLRTGAEPSPAYFNILMHGKNPEVLDGTQLAADWTFAGLQKFGQGLEERLRGLKYPSKLLEKVNIVEIPGILEVRKQVSRVFPFNDACQWFIDRADIIFLVYDPSKLDVGPETEAILDQLKGRESQTRIVLNKADSVKPEELMRVQSALIWNISPLMSSAQPPVMYTVSLWSLPFEPGAPVRLLQAQERELLRDLRHALDKRIDNKIASARRFAVRVRNHAKMVDCYLTTYYNHKTIFGNRKLIADAIIENPQNYHIYEGLSTLTNISRYDLPDPETYRDFFRLNPLYEFQQLTATCTYFRGCPITRLDVAIAYDLPELVGKYKKMVESAAPQGMPKS